MSAVRSLHARVAVLLMLVLGSVGACFAVAGWYYAWVTAGSAHDTLLRYGASQIAETIVSSVVKAGQSARQLDVGRLDDDHAAALADDLAEPLHDLDRLRQRLRARDGG